MLWGLFLVHRREQARRRAGPLEALDSPRADRSCSSQCCAAACALCALEKGNIMMKKRDLYKEKFEAQIHEWKAKIDLMAAQGEKLSVQTKLDIKPHLDSLQAKFDAAKARVVEIASATGDELDAIAAAIEDGWTDIKSTAEGAQKAIKSGVDQTT